MATESNTGFHCEEALSSALNRHAISFQSGAINSTSEMIPMGSYYAVNTSGAMIFSGSSSAMVGAGVAAPANPVIGHQAGSSSPGSSLLLDSVPGLKHDVGLAVEWSVDEQCKLERGLIEYSNEPSILRYIKIAALLRDKTVRDVALRCRWMMVRMSSDYQNPLLPGSLLIKNRKRRKAEELGTGKKVINRKDKLAESSSKAHISSVPSLDMAGYPFMMSQIDQNRCMPFEDMSGTAKHLLEQNTQVFNQITANLSTYKLQDNIDLFYRTRSNIAAILNDMRHMPGIMSQMPPLPVSINEDLANNIMPNTA